MKKLYEEALRVFGKHRQVLVAVEELAELQKELLKDVNRGRYNVEGVIDEYCDVQIMLEQIKLIYNISPDKIAERREMKLNRLKKYIEETK